MSSASGKPDARDELIDDLGRRALLGVDDEVRSLVLRTTSLEHTAQLPERIGVIEQRPVTHVFADSPQRRL